MKTKIFLWILIFSLFSAASAPQDDVLRVEASVVPKTLSRGQEGKIVLRLHLQEKLTISPHPFFLVEFNPPEELVLSKNIFTADDLKIETVVEDGEESLNIKEPLEIPFIVRLEAASGAHRLEGKVKYFARSREEGWCLKSASKFGASFSTRRSIFKKKR